MTEKIERQALAVSRGGNGEAATGAGTRLARKAAEMPGSDKADSPDQPLFPWGNKRRFNAYSDFLRRHYGTRLQKLSVNAGFSCPNRDGRVGTGGCIFCSASGSGDFAGSASDSVATQLEKGKKALQDKRPIRSYIAYFQAFTNTYAPVAYLEKIFTEAISDPDVKILSIATRPDCLGPDVIALLERLNRIKPVWVELGLQTVHPETALLIRRGYPTARLS